MILKNASRKKLSRPYISVNTGNSPSFGGSQTWHGVEKEKRRGLGRYSRENRIRGYGCGLISAADILSYLKGEGGGARPTIEEYSERIRRLDKKYFHTPYYFGINGMALARKLNHLFKKEGLAYRARWRVAAGKMIGCIEEMIENDIPVMLSIGPAVLKKDRLNLYAEKGSANAPEYVKASSTKDHYVTVTGIVEDESYTMLEISSWGKRYYIDLAEYVDYVERNDNTLFSNILYIRRKA